MTAQAYFLPRSLDEALSLLAEHGSNLLVMAGGTLAMPLINEGVSMPEKVLGLRQAGLNYVKPANGTVTIGAMTTLTQMRRLEAIPLLQEAAQHVGAWAIRNLGTVGGNLFAPPPAGDFAVALLALDARIKLAKSTGERIIPLSEFYTGFMTTVLQPGEIVAEIQVNLPQGRTAYLKYGRKHENTPAIVTVALHLTLDGQLVKDARLALNGVGPHPIRVRQTEAALVGSKLDEKTIKTAAATAAAECEPFTDPVASEWYRRKMVEVYVRRALEQVAGQIAG